MRIIDPGQRPEFTPLRGTCRMCGCQIECTQGECTWMSDRPGDPTGAYAIQCPTCQGWIYPKGGEAP